MKKTSVLKYSRIAGLLSVIMLIIGTTILFIQSKILVENDLLVTIENISKAGFLFRLSIFGSLLLQVLFIFFVILLYKIYKPVNKIYAFFMIVTALVAVPIAMFNELNHYAVLIILDGSTSMKNFSTEQLHAIIKLFLDLYKYGLLIATIFWGIWLLPLGLLAVKSEFVPRVLGVLLMLGCFAYLIRFIMSFLLQSYSELLSPGLAIAHIGEVLHGLWLLIMGVNVEQWNNQYRKYKSGNNL